jgi:ATP-dependent Clp protease protease subunit
MNVTQMDVFSRLMQDRIIFLGTEIDSDVANIITAQLFKHFRSEMRREWFQ